MKVHRIDGFVKGIKSQNKKHKRESREIFWWQIEMAMCVNDIVFMWISEQC